MDFDSFLGTIENPEAGLVSSKPGASQPQEPNLRVGLLEAKQTSQVEEDGQVEGEGDGTDSQVQELEGMMLKMQAVKGKPRSNILFSPSPESAFLSSNHLS